jgi:hypothetical protein
MEDEIEKLLYEYRLKIDDCQRQLAGYDTAISHLRRNKQDYSLERKDQARTLTKMICYQQTSADIDSLLDYVPSAALDEKAN